MSALIDEVKVSVIICTRNRANYLPECLSSIASQKAASSFEVIVVDNNSTDGTPALLREWCRNDSRFRSTREDRLGLSRAKNAGIALARGNLLIFTDDDVVVEPHWLETYNEFFARQMDRRVIAGGPIIPIPADLGDWPMWFHRRALCNVGLLDYESERPLEKWEYLWGANMAIPRWVISDFGPWDDSVGRRGEERGTFEDIEYQDRVRIGGVSTWFCPDAVVHHRVDRRTVTPRGVVSKAFARGRNEFLQKVLLMEKPLDGAVKRNLIICVTALGRYLTLWLFWTVAFRLSASGSLFEWSRCAASSSGWWFGSLQAWGDSKWSRRALARVVFATRGLVLRWTPDIS